VLVQKQFDTLELAPGKPVVLAKPDRTYRTVQIEDRLRPRPDDVDMCWPVVVRVDNYAKVAKSQNGRHRRRIAYS
jgi:hypothetical protein